MWISTALVGSVLAFAPGAEATFGAHPDANTPGSGGAVIFSPAPEGPARASFRYVRSKLEDHSYSVLSLVDSDAFDNDPEQATAANFKTHLTRKGVVYINTHGSRRALLVESYRRRRFRNQALNAYLADGTFRRREVFKCAADHEDSGVTRVIRGICMSDAAIDRYFDDNDSIVVVVSCHSLALGNDFRAREFFGYDRLCFPSEGANDVEFLVGRMHGEKGFGDKRAASVAYGPGGPPYSAGFKYRHKPGELDTVLSPAVRLQRPGKNAVVTPLGAHDGMVEFDTAMLTSIPGTDVIAASGCVAIHDAAWVNARTLGFRFVANAPGAGTFTVRATGALSDPMFQNWLDGNGSPAAIEHVGPNKDDYTWNVTCA